MREGASIVVFDETELASLSPDGITLGTKAYVTEDKTDFVFRVSGRPILVTDTDEVVALTSTWTFVNGNFRDTDIGATFTMAGTLAVDGEYTIATVVSPTEITTEETPADDETFDTAGITCTLDDAPLEEGSVVEVFGTVGVRWFAESIGPVEVETSSPVSGNGTVGSPITIADGTLALAKTVNIAAARVIGNPLGGSVGAPSLLTPAQIAAIAGSRTTRYNTPTVSNTVLAFGGTLDGDNDGGYFVNFNLWFTGDPGTVKLQFNGADTGCACRWQAVNATDDSLSGGHSNTTIQLATASSNGNVLSGSFYIPSGRGYRVGNATFVNTSGQGEQRNETIFFTTDENITGMRFICQNGTIDSISFADVTKLYLKAP